MNEREFSWFELRETKELEDIGSNSDKLEKIYFNN